MDTNPNTLAEGGTNRNNTLPPFSRKDKLEQDDLEFAIIRDNMAKNEGMLNLKTSFVMNHSRNGLRHRSFEDHKALQSLLARFASGCATFDVNAPSTKLMACMPDAPTDDETEPYLVQSDVDNPPTNLTIEEKLIRTFLVPTASYWDVQTRKVKAFNLWDEEIRTFIEVEWTFRTTLLVDTINRLSINHRITPFDIRLLANLINWLQEFRLWLASEDLAAEIFSRLAFTQLDNSMTISEVLAAEYGLLYDEAFETLRRAFTMVWYPGVGEEKDPYPNKITHKDYKHVWAVNGDGTEAVAPDATDIIHSLFAAGWHFSLVSRRNENAEVLTGRVFGVARGEGNLSGG